MTATLEPAAPGGWGVLAVPQLPPFVWERVAASWDRPVLDVAANPAQFVEERLGEYLWSMQRVILDSVQANRYTAVKSCHQVGKSRIASRAVAWWGETTEVGKSLVITTAPTAAQVSGVLWREIIQAHIEGDLKGKINRAGYPRWFAGPGDKQEIGFGRKPDDNREAAFQGYHAERVLVVVDEACGVKAGIWNQLDSLIGNVDGRVLAIGNPDDPTSYFAQVCKPESVWHVIRIDALRSPNFRLEDMGPCAAPGCNGHPLTQSLMLHEGIPFSTEHVEPVIRKALVSAHWVEERLREWAGCLPSRSAEVWRVGHLNGGNAGGWAALGAYVSEQSRSSALVTAKVRGEFPDDSTSSIIPLAWVQAAIDRGNDFRWLEQERQMVARDRGAPAPDPVIPAGRLVVSVDVAHGGEDKTVLVKRRGDWFGDLERHTWADTIPTVKLTRAYVNAEPGASAVVDGNGLGAGVVDMLRAGVPEASILPISVVSFIAQAQSGRRSRNGDLKFRNDRSAAWWNLREMLDPSRSPTIMLPDDEELLAELIAPDYKVLTGGVVAVEEKDDVKKRLGRSTDAADAVVMAAWVDGSGIEYGAGDDDEFLPYGDASPYDADVFKPTERTWDR